VIVVLIRTSFHPSACLPKRKAKASLLARQGPQ
jgi:hypothetical protein